MSVLAAWMPGAVCRPIPYRAEAGRFVNPPLGSVPHVVVGNGSPFGLFAKATSPNRKFSHFWVSKKGLVEQYAETFYKSWAQGVGNGLYWTIETEGFPDEPYTPEQIDALGRINKFLGVPALIADKPGARGVGTHYMGGAAWGGHSCPDPAGQEGRGPRSKARVDIIKAATGEVVKQTTPVAGVTTKTDPAGVDRHRTARLQAILELVPDGLWGDTTDEWALRMRTAVRAHCGYPHNTVAGFDEAKVQRVIDVAPDGVWGPKSQAALEKWLLSLQSVLGVAQDGEFGPAGEAAFKKLRDANLGKF